MFGIKLYGRDDRVIVNLLPAEQVASHCKICGFAPLAIKLYLILLTVDTTVCAGERTGITDIAVNRHALINFIKL
jgi:hypothetical protein